MPGLGLAFAEDRRPKAFVALSPEGAGDDGFLPTSWDTVARPVLMCTGARDGDAPHERRDPFEYMPGGDKYLFWIEHEGAQHTVFEGDTRACFAAVHDQTVCDEMQAWLGSVMRAFLDAYVREDPTAVADGICRRRRLFARRARSRAEPGRRPLRRNHPGRCRRRSHSSPAARRGVLRRPRPVGWRRAHRHRARPG